MNSSERFTAFLTLCVGQQDNCPSQSNLTLTSGLSPTLPLQYLKLKPSVFKGKRKEKDRSVEDLELAVLGRSVGLFSSNPPYIVLFLPSNKHYERERDTREGQITIYSP